MTLRTLSRFGFTLSTLTIAVLFFALVARSQAPDDAAGDEAADAPAESEEPAAADPDNPFGSTLPGDDPNESDPIVLAIRDSNPKTPDDFARAVGILINAKRFDVAKRYLGDLIASTADDNALLQVYEKYGPAWFLRLARIKELAPEAEQLTRRALDVAQEAAANPARINALVDQLADRKTRAAAMTQLRRGGPAVVSTLVAVLADPDRAELHKPIQSALLGLGSDATEPLVAALEQDNPELQTRIIAVLDATGDRVALPKLTELAFAPDVPESVRNIARRSIASTDGRLPSREAVERFLSNQFFEAFRDRVEDAPAALAMDEYSDGEVSEDADLVTIWLWEQERQDVVPEEVTRETAARQRALRASEALVAVAADNPKYQTWKLAAFLDWEQALAGMDTNIVAEPGPVLTAVTEAGPLVINEVLQFALDTKREAAAIAAVNALGAIADQQILQASGGKTSTLVAALQDTEPRVQFAAARAIMRINPTDAFAGSNHFRDVLALMLGSATARKALVANAKLAEAQTWGGILEGLGWDAEIVGTGTELLQRISKSPYYEFVLLNDAIEKPALLELLQVIRQTSGGGEMPVAVLCRPETYRDWKDRLEALPLVVTLPLPANEEFARLAVKRVTSLPGRRMPPPEVRQEYASQALEWIRLTADSPYAPIYDLVQIEGELDKLLYDSPLAPKAAQVLGVFGTRDAQKRLVDVASQPAYGVNLRKSAAKAFADAVSRRGAMLTKAEILQQYERYNASAQFDAETQQILGSILDVLETWLNATQESAITQ